MKSEPLFDRWLAKMVEKLQNAALPKAGLRLMQVVAQSSTQSGGNWNWKRAYLEGYFFDEYLGLGLPKLIASASAFNASGQLQLQAISKGVPALPSTVGAPTFSSSGSTVDLSSVPLGIGGSPSLVSGCEFGPSASVVGTGTDQAHQMTTMIASALKEALHPLNARLDAIEGPSRGAALSGRDLMPVVSGRKCLFCGRETCEFIRGGDPCREAKQAETARNQSQAAKRRAAEAATAAASASREGG